eukprot:TRINITY_DN3425_c0_g2_i1.p1 TRINITY_DN3425_c0_g2~~TRINITY_DN3425_c0_g2_i1.p1  ORF type:complete len:303 (-),score=44.61 TRINITY_DN3425_c0_g2_i1:35-943(-)
MMHHHETCLGPPRFVILCQHKHRATIMVPKACAYAMFCLCFLLVAVHGACECGFQVQSNDHVAVYTHSIITNFTDPSMSDIGPDWVRSNYPIKDKPYSQQYVPANVYRAIGGLGLNIRVQRYAGSGPVIGGEMQSSRTDILYGSFRASLQISNVSGACQSIFFDKTDSQEVDIEFLTATPHTVHFTNQPHYTNATALGFDPTSAFHQYRFDWAPAQTTFYVDDILRTTLAKDVPNTPGEILLNSWSNGDPEWSGGPPAQDAVLRVEWVQMFFNTTNSSDNISRQKACTKATHEGQPNLTCKV